MSKNKGRSLNQLNAKAYLEKHMTVTNAKYLHRGKKVGNFKYTKTERKMGIPMAAAWNNIQRTLLSSIGVPV